MKPFIFLFFLTALFSCTALAYAPPELPAVKADPEAAKKAEKQPRSKFVCKVTGRLHCSEYGTRYKDPLLVVFDDGGGKKYSAPVSEKDGAFEAALPLGEAYSIKVQFRDKSAEIGRLDCPLADGDTAKSVDIYQPGSELELVWGLRDGGGVDVDIKVKDGEAR